MQKKNVYFGLIFILLISLFVSGVIFPAYINRAIYYIGDLLDTTLPSLPQTSFKLGLDLQGGSRLVYEADLSNIVKGEEDEAVAGLRDVIERRVNVLGVTEPVVSWQKSGEHYRLIVELPGVKDVKEAIEAIGKTPLLEFREERSEEEKEEILKEQKEKSSATSTTSSQPLSSFEDPYFKPTKLNGQYLKRASLEFDQTTYKPYVVLEFNKEGAKLFEEITARNVGKKLAIYIDGVPISVPVVREKISGGRAQITGEFTVEEARKLARNLNAGALPVPIKLISQTTVGPALGAVSLQKSLKAAVYGFLGVVLFIIVFYRLSGVAASLALFLYAGILLSLFKLIPVTLTLAGIGGAILSVGMAVDANILIFERMKEELKRGQGFSRALAEGFSRAWPSIRDSNFTTLLVAFIMFALGSSFVRGFALTLSLGIFVSLFSALFVTRVFMSVFAGTRLEKIKWLWG